MSTLTVETVKQLGGYKLIYLDPPWAYRNAGVRGAAEHQYSTMATSEIAALPVKDLAARDCAMLIWATWPNLREVFTVLDAWGFEYKTLGFIWVKRNSKAGTPFWGCGSWSRANTEPCFLATRGKPTRVSKGVHQLVETWDVVDNVLDAPVGRHSAKPALVRERAVELLGDVPRLEMFAREGSPGWDVWGNEVESTIQL